MRKLLLASNGKFVTETGYRLFNIPLKDIRIVYITTASKNENNKAYVEQHKQAMHDAGLQFEEFDIEDKSRTELTEKFRDHNIVYVEGGNTFYLLKAMRESGFATIVKQLIENGMAYIGTSAGAHVAAPTIETSTWNLHAKNRYGVTDLRALNLVPFLIKSHYTDEKWRLFQQKIQQTRYPVKFLRDSQGIFVQDTTYTLVGDGPEVPLSSPVPSLGKALY